MLILPILTEPAFSAANSSTTGVINRQGPHHGAQKSTSTGLLDCSTSSRKFSSVNSETCLPMAAMLRSPVEWLLRVGLVSSAGRAIRNYREQGGGVKPVSRSGHA